MDVLDKTLFLMSTSTSFEVEFAAAGRRDGRQDYRLYVGRVKRCHHGRGRLELDGRTVTQPRHKGVQSHHLAFAR